MPEPYNPHLYDREFFATIAPTARAAATLVVPYLLALTRPKFVVDLGCATGEWLAPFLEQQVQVCGIDLPAVPEELLSIPAESFVGWDVVSQGFPPVTGRFDLALCLETAEHLPQTSAEPLVAWLTSAAPAVFFGAAVPQQNGVGHINEQPTMYWWQLFERYSFRPVTALSALITDSRIPSYYLDNAWLLKEQR